MEMRVASIDPRRLSFTPCWRLVGPFVCRMGPGDAAVARRRVPPVDSRRSLK
jgi:hypothetical protein